MSEVNENVIDFPKVSMSIIIAAGDARNCALKAMELMLEGKGEEADSCLLEAKNFIKQAHQSQTEVMQTLAFREYNEGAEEERLPMLFIHAQDTIMTIMSEVNMTEQMMKMYKKIEEEISICKK